MNYTDQLTLNPIAAAREVAALVAAHAAEVDEEGMFPEAGLRELRQSRLMGLLVPQEYGGYGASYATMAQVAQIIAASCLSTGMIWAMHCQQVATIIDHAPGALLDSILPNIACGDMFVASVTSEREKGGHLLTAFSPLMWEEDEVVLFRDAPVVTGGAFGDGYLITMRASPESPPSDVVLVFAERAQLEIDIRAGWETLGMRGTQSVGMLLRGRLPRRQVFSVAGGFEQIAISTMIPVGHIAWASAWLGAARGAYRRVIDLFRDPEARKGYNLQSELFAARLAEVRLQIDTVSSYLQQVVQDYEQIVREHGTHSPLLRSPRFSIHINNLKLLSSDLLFNAINQLVQLSGLRFGYQKNNRVPLERTLRDLRSASLMYANDRLLVANGKLALLDRDDLQV
jgi:acyl-CoA dehydrogenase